jgi:hypothetical protein
MPDMWARLHDSKGAGTMIGEISAEESNFNSRKRGRIKSKVKGRSSPREFTHQIAIPTWLDRKYIAAYAEEHGCTVAEATTAIFKRDY